ncbi:MAG: Zinc uptake regulation protein Zur [Rhodanobacteraceae bacterium]|jgi:Fur family zinc uptake transcriptional regulator|nr:MAG: Zinc uptake regulation protein Zur [Rhodanobacteraceae bacterium]
MVTARKHVHHHHHDAAGIVREVEHECTSRGLRLTPLRREVLDLVAKARKPVKAYDLLESLRDNHAGAAPPTVYRALDFLLENGFIHKLESINAFVFCQHPAEAHQVPFLICDVCEGATELCDEGSIARLIEQQAKGFGFRAKAQTLEVHGVCKACRPA